MKIYYIVNARIPNVKAYGIQIAKMCEAFIERGMDVELVIPKTYNAGSSLKEFYNLRVEVPTRVLPGLDWYGKGKVASAVASLVFTACACLYLLHHRKNACIYTIDMDPYWFAPLAFLRLPLAVEMHSPKTSNLFTRSFFTRVTHIIALNTLIKEELIHMFNLRQEYFLIEPNGVDPSAFTMPSREEARMALRLPADEKIILYVGRFYDWKGMDILLRTAPRLRESGITLYLVGGSRRDFEVATGKSSDAIRFGGSVPHNEVALWCAASDALLVLGTKTNDFSYRYTAPMKMFEYLAAGRPVVAADTPALREMVTEKEVTFYTPDDADDLTAKISELLSVPTGEDKVAKGILKARQHIWQERAQRIAAFMGVV